MEVVCFRAEAPNFGDDLNQFLWDDLLPGHRDVAPDVTLFGVGTILAKRFQPPKKGLVVGSGAGYGKPLNIRNRTIWDVRAVRGPKTAAMMGVSADRAVCDPAMMLPTLERFSGIRQTEEVLFIPHFRTLPQLDWDGVAKSAGVAYQSPSDHCETVIRRIAAARGVIAESMHAAIIADAFGVPWYPVEVGEKFNHFKWRDWAESLSFKLPRPRPFFRGIRLRNDVSRHFQRFFPSNDHPSSWLALVDTSRLAEQASQDINRISKSKFLLSDRAALAALQERFMRVLDEIKIDYGLLPC